MSKTKTQGLIRVYDNPQFKDRYTIFYLPEKTGNAEYISLSDDCDTPLGVSQFGLGCEGNCGVLIQVSDLPNNVRTHLSKLLQVVSPHYLSLI